MKLFMLIVFTCCLVGCEASRTTTPNTTSVKVDVGKGGVDIEVKKK